MKQFEIRWVNLPCPAGRRPVLLLSRITSTIRAIAVEVRVGQREGLPAASVVNLDSIRTASRPWFDSRAGALAPSRHREVKRALGYALGWDELIDSPLP